MNPIVGIVGHIGAGKTSVAQALGRELDYCVASFGRAIRDRTRSLELNASDRSVLRQVGEEWVAHDPEGLCRAVLEACNWRDGVGLVVEGFRHLNVIAKFRQLVSPQRLILVYLEVPDAALAIRQALKGLTTEEQRTQAAAHSTEIEVATRIRALVDFLVPERESARQTALAIVGLLRGE